MKKSLLWTIPLVIGIAGCEQKTTTSTEPIRARETNANVVDADNTARNARDRTNATLTPLDQGTSAADVELSQKIRQGLVIDPSNYSVAAKNVKVITVNGKVTLRGPVQTEAEKNAVAALARSLAGDGNVDDQLEVKANP